MNYARNLNSGQNKKSVRSSLSYRLYDRITSEYKNLRSKQCSNPQRKIFRSKNCLRSALDRSSQFAKLSSLEIGQSGKNKPFC